MHASVPATGSLVDAYAPREIAHRVEVLGVTKAQSDAVTVLVLAILAGAFIALGALFFIVVVTHSLSGFGMTRLVGGIAFSLGLILVVIGGAELFTGNNLVAMAWASRRITSRELWRNWGLVYLGNAVGGPWGRWGWCCSGTCTSWGRGRSVPPPWPLGDTRPPWV